MIGFIQRIRAYFSDPEHARFRQILLLLLIVTALPLIVIAAQQQQTLRQRAGGGGVLLTLSPTSGTAQVGELLSVDVILQASSNNITGVDVSVQFNDAILSVNKFVPGTQFNAEVVNRVDPATSTFRYVATSTDASAQITGDIRLGTLVLEPKASGQGTVSFQASQVTALGNPDGLSVSSENGSYVVTIPISPTVEPTATPSATPTAILTPTATSNPTLPPTATSTPLPTNTPVPPTPTTAPVVGDANGDRIVNILDYNIWRDEFLGTVSTKTSDFNRDGKIDLLDFNIWRTAFNNTSPTSSPTTAATSTPIPPTPTLAPSPTPTRIPTPTITPTPTPLPASSLYKRVFVTNFTYAGRYVKDSDAICRAFANNAYLGGSWKAWISYPNNSVSTRLTRSNVPYKLLNGWTVANDWTDLTNGDLFDGPFPPSISLTADMKGVSTYVWTGTTTSGNTSANTCNGWTSTSGGEFGDAGWSSNNDDGWTQSFQLRCGTSTGSGPAEGAFYCFEQ